MKYIENPKLEGSGILACIPQKGICPIGCEDCFFQGGRSYLEPIENNLPNIPGIEDSKGRIVRINDGNDSNNQRDHVINVANQYENYFYNTAIPEDLEGFKKPVVLTVNPGKMTDKAFHKLKTIPKNLMMVRVRTNMWNIPVIDSVVQYYSEENNIPVILTIMAYYNTTISEKYRDFYSYQIRILNSYCVLNKKGLSIFEKRYENKRNVHFCGNLCKNCGHCLREYYNTKERLRNEV